MKSRYFVIFYIGVENSSITTYGHSTFITTGNYPSSKGIVKKIRKDESDFDEVALTNIMELNKKDFVDWISGKDV